MKYIVLLLVLLLPTWAFAEPVDVNVWYGWDPVEMRLDDTSAAGQISHYTLYICDKPITEDGLEGIQCAGTLSMIKTGAVGDDGLLVGQPKPWEDDTGHFAIRTQAEDFDNGGEGISWHDTDVGNNYDVHHAPYRTNVDVDIRCSPFPGCKSDPKEFQLGNGATGEWQVFTVDIISAGEYTPVVAIATTANVTMTMAVNGIERTFQTGNTGDWDTKKEIVGDKLTLAAGKHAFTFTNTVGPIDFDWWELRGKTEVTKKGKFDEVNEPTVLFLAPVTMDEDATIHARAMAVDKDGRESKLSNQTMDVVKDLIEETEPVDTLSPAAPVLRVVE
ncbi:MAG: hypothetical protein ACR2QI_04145 [Woeseiaceae bacterium]